MQPWTPQQAHQWYDQQPWLVGCNYIPATAINPLEMWQAETFDPQRIKLELGWAAQLGFNTIRVFLHDLVWAADPNGMLQRMNQLLEIADAFQIKVMWVLFDSCWNPFPIAGKQLEPRPGLHNSGWVQSPGAHALHNRAEWGRLEDYVRGVVRAFASDPRVLIWDLWNEPDMLSPEHWGRFEPLTKVERVTELLPLVFAWARSEQPQQPLTSAVWDGNWSSETTLNPVQSFQLNNSDLISFHNYEPAAGFASRVDWLLSWGRPLLCTEYLARSRGSTLEAILPIAQKQRVSMYTWGFVDGKTQTRFPWDSYQRPYTEAELEVWFHDLLHTDGTPYRSQETNLLKEVLLQKEST